MMAEGRKIKGDYAAKPAWLSIARGLMPDYIVTDPKQSDVWEITGAEFSQSSVHTAGGISIRFPRVTKIRDDKDWRTATDLPRLQLLARTSQEKADEAITKLMIREGGGKLVNPGESCKPSPEKPSVLSAKEIKSEREDGVAKPIKSEGNGKQIKSEDSGKRKLTAPAQSSVVQPAKKIKLESNTDG